MSAASSPSPVCPMIRLLGADSGSRFALLSHVPIVVLANLARTCSSWRRWIDSDGAMPKQQWWASADRAAALAACPWLPRHLGGLSLDCTHVRGLDPPNDCSKLSTAADWVVRLPHLRSLQISLDHACSDDQLWSRCFLHLAPTLETLSLWFSFSIRYDTTVVSMVKHLDKLVRLNSLSIFGLCDEPEEIDISALPKLPRLQHVAIRTGATDFLWSARQMPHLCNCKQLVSLSGGFGRPEEFVWEQRVIDFIDSRFPPDAPPLPVMTGLRLPAITPAVWAHLTRLSSLEALEPYRWIGFGADEWSQLPKFTTLRRVMLQPVSMDAILDASLFSGALSGCVTVKSLQFGRVRLSEANLRLLTSGLPLLSSLSFTASILEGLASLSLASALTKLSFHHCTCFGDVQKPFEVRRQLPPLSKLRELSICPAEGDTQEQRDA